MATRVASAVAVGTALDASNTPTTIAVDAGSGTNRFALAWAFWRNNQSHNFNQLGAVSFSPDNFTELVAPVDMGTAFIFQAWYLDEPATGSNNLVFQSQSGVGTQASFLVGYLFAEDVDSATLLGALNSYRVSNHDNALGANATISETVTSADDALLVLVSAFRDAAAVSARTATASTHIDVIADVDTGSFTYNLAVGYGDGATASDTPAMTWDNNAASIERHFAIALPNAAAGGLAIPIASYYYQHLHG
jgi:hypothetical protein